MTGAPENLLEKIEASKQIIAKALEKYPRTAVACSFGKDSLVVLALAREVKPDIPVFSVLTPMKPPETFAFKEELEHFWNINISVYMADQEPIPDLWKTDPDQCCQIFKVEPTLEALKGLDAWITGLRRTEGRTRTDFEPFEVCNGTMKVNPILDWTELDIWRYTAIFGVPVNPAYQKGYRSLGCAPCTVLVKDNETERAGRWIGTSKCGGECGIHTMHKKGNGGKVKPRSEPWATTA
ncbi:MAG: phosphoadenylyl-sulfate reductase [Candidatus Hodarchaeota archaeon]